MFKKLIVPIMCTAVLAFALASCGNSSSAPKDSSAEPSAAPAQAQAANVIEKAFFKVALPANFTESDKEYVFNEENGGSVYVSVINNTAEGLVEIESADEDFNVTGTVEAGGMPYTVVKSDKWNKAYWIADYEDGCVEIIVNRIDDDDIVKAFLDGLTFEPDAYKKWQEASKAARS